MLASEGDLAQCVRTAVTKGRTATKPARWGDKAAKCQTIPHRSYPCEA